MDVMVVDDPEEEEVPPARTLKRVSRSASSTRSLQSLPHGVGNDPLWRTKFIPTAIALYGIDPDVWKYDAKPLAPVLQRIWDAVFPGRNAMIRPSAKDPVFFQVRVHSLIHFARTNDISRLGRRFTSTEMPLAERLSTL